MKPRLFGTSPYLPDAAFLNADELSRQSGGNTGNLMFCHSVSRMLNTSTESIPWGTGAANNLDPETDILVMPLANQLGAHVDMGKLAKIMEAIPVPLIGVGLGTQGPIGGLQASAIPDGSWEWVRVLASKSLTGAPNISLRGESTYQVLAEKGFGDNCIVTGCPSNFLNPSPHLGREINRRRSNGIKRIAVAAGNPYIPQFRQLEYSLVELLNKHEGMYVCQHPIDMLRLAKREFDTISHANYYLYRQYIAPKLSDDEFFGWFAHYAYAFSSVPEWLATMSRYDLVIGTRIHGIMAGIQAGVPSVCLCIDSRTLELCQTMRIPHINANDVRDGISLSHVNAALKAWDWRAFDENRIRLAQVFINFFADNGLKTRGILQHIISENSKFIALRKTNEVRADTHQFSTGSSEDRYESVFGAIAKHFSPPPLKILSFGCADGYELNDLAGKYFTSSMIYGCDIDALSLRIAKRQNPFPARVKVMESIPDDIKKAGPFDLIVAMSVFCRWPDSRDAENIEAIYSFKKFCDAIEYLVSLLSPNGLLCVYNANFQVSDTPISQLLEPINLPELPRSQEVRLFSAEGAPLIGQRSTTILFRKRSDISDDLSETPADVEVPVAD